MNGSGATEPGAGTLLRQGPGHWRTDQGAGAPRVLIVVRWPVGGIRTWLRYVLTTSELAGFQITLAVPDLPETAVLCGGLRDAPVRIEVLSARPIKFALQVVRAVLGGGYALVHAHGFTAAMICALPAKLVRARHLVSQHDMILDHQYRTLSGRLVRAAIGRGLGMADAVHAASEAARRNLLGAFPGLGSGADRVVAVPHGIDVERFRTAAPVDVRARYGLPRAAPILGFFGRFMSPKGFRCLIDAVEILVRERRAGVAPVVVAVGGGGFQAREERDIRRRGLQEHFVFVGHTDNVAGIMKGTDVVVMPSLWEACGLVAMEALAAGVPLIVSDCPALCEIAEGSPARVVPRADAGALAAAVRAAIASAPAAEAYAPEAAVRFGAERNAAGIAALYRRLLGRE